MGGSPWIVARDGAAVADAGCGELKYAGIAGVDAGVASGTPAEAT